MKTWTRLETGIYQSGESQLTITPLDGIDDYSVLKPVMFLHGRGDDASSFVPGWGGGNHAQRLATEGYYVFSINGGGPNPWNADYGQTAITNAYNYLQTLGFSTTKVGLFAWSGGGGGFLQWLKNNSSKVARTSLWAPMTDMDHFHAISTYTAEIDAQYGGVYANSAGHRIADEFTSWQGKGDIQLHHGTADTTVPIALSQNFVAGVARSNVTLVTLPGYTHSTLFLGVNTDDTVAFFDGGNW